MLVHAKDIGVLYLMFALISALISLELGDSVLNMFYNELYCLVPVAFCWFSYKGWLPM